MKNLTKETWQMICQNLGSVLLFELLYRGITMPVYLRFANRGIRFALRMSGESYLTAGNLGNFLFRPWTIVLLLVLGITGVLLLLFEAAGLMTAFQGSAYYQRLTPFHIFWGALQKLVEQSAPNSFCLGVLTFAEALLINLLFAGRVLMHVRPLNFVIREMLSAPVILTYIILCLAILLAMVIPAVFVPFGCMVEQKSYLASLGKSFRLMQGHGVRAVLLLFFAVLASAALTVVLFMVIMVLAAVLVVCFTEKKLELAMVLLVADRLEPILLMVGSGMTTVACVGVLSALYFHYGTRGYREAGWQLHQKLIGRRGKRRIALAAAVILLAGSLYTLDLVHNGFSIPDEMLKETQITAHRGSSRAAPENTMAALQAAVEELADYAEIDVQLTADGVIVLGHDSSLKRVAGVNRSISSMTFEELSSLDVGSWFAPEYAGEQIPSLRQVLEFCRGKLRLNIEIKNVGGASPLPELTARMVQEQGMEEQCVITSTSLSYLIRVKAAAPELMTGYIISAAYGDFYSHEAVDFISIRSSFVNEKLVEQVHEKGKEIHAWTVNQKSEMERLRLLGVDNIITDDPVLAREIIYREETTEGLLEYLRMIIR